MIYHTYLFRQFNLYSYRYPSPDLPKWSCELAQIPSPSGTLSKLTPTLEPFKEIFELKKSGQLLASVAIPSVLSLIKLVEQKPPCRVTSLLVEELQSQLEIVNSRPVFRAATFLDPRYALSHNPSSTLGTHLLLVLSA